MMIAGITVLALGFCMPQMRGWPRRTSRRSCDRAERARADRVVGFLLAGLAAAFMSEFRRHHQRRAAYVVNDIYKRFINPNSGGRAGRSASRLTAILFLVVGVVCGIPFYSITTAMMFLVGALYGGFVIANVLNGMVAVQWLRLLLGMVTGIGSALVAQLLVGDRFNVLTRFRPSSWCPSSGPWPARC